MLQNDCCKTDCCKITGLTFKHIFCLSDFNIHQWQQEGKFFHAYRCDLAESSVQFPWDKQFHVQFVYDLCVEMVGDADNHW